jgi:hypothetical protein
MYCEVSAQEGIVVKSRQNGLNEGEGVFGAQPWWRGSQHNFAKTREPPCISSKHSCAHMIMGMTHNRL